MKNVDFNLTHIDLTDKPDWFLKVSPHGKVPVLDVDGAALFESNAIAEYLDDVVEPKVHPVSAFKRARNRAWTDYVPDFCKGINFYYTKTRQQFDEKLFNAPEYFQKLEDAISNERGNDGPYFNGSHLCLVDAAYAPFLMRFSMIEEIVQTKILKDFPLVKAWTDALVASPCVLGSVAPNFKDVFFSNLKNRGFYVGGLLGDIVVAAE